MTTLVFEIFWGLLNERLVAKGWSEALRMDARHMFDLFKDVGKAADYLICLREENERLAR